MNNDVNSELSFEITVLISELRLAIDYFQSEESDVREFLREVSRLGQKAGSVIKELDNVGTDNQTK